MLTAIQKAAIRHLIAYDQSPPESRLSHDEWSEQMGISKRTLERWKLTDEFKSAWEQQRREMEETSDPYALVARTIALEQLMHLMNKKGLTVTEKRMVIKDVMDSTKHVDSTGDVVDYSEMTDEDLVAAILSRELSPVGMTEAQLMRLAKSDEDS